MTIFLLHCLIFILKRVNYKKLEWKWAETEIRVESEESWKLKRNRLSRKANSENRTIAEEPENKI